MSDAALHWVAIGAAIAFGIVLLTFFLRPRG